MIAMLTGVIADKTADTIIMDVQGVGYEANVSLRTLQALPGVGNSATVHVVTNVREDAIQLFAFHDTADKRMFQRLVSVSGIGPKIAVNAFSLMSAVQLQSAIISADLKALSAISGVGKKTAQRIILELGEKILGLDLGGGSVVGPTPVGALADLRGALSDLGYAPKEAESVVAQLREDAKNGDEVEVLLRKALGLLRS
ncbi:MAG: Holliday junction DNA helicase RuvA [Bradymonadia bacterium]|jgi:Holliday junction DNA helicase RuvA